MMEDEVKRALKELKRGLRALYGERLVSLYLYGSYSRSGAHRGSDVDVLVVLEGLVSPRREIARMGALVARVCLKYDVLISVYPVSPDWLLHRQSPFYKNVRREALLISTPRSKRCWRRQGAT